MFLLKRINRSALLRLLSIFLIVGIFILGFSSGYLFKGSQAREGNSAVNKIHKGLIEKAASLNIYDLVNKEFQNDKAGIKWSTLAEDGVSGIQLVEIKDQMGTHIHKTEDHYTYVVSGNGEYVQNENKINLKPGVFLLTKSKTPHRVKNLGKDPLVLLVFSTPKSFQENDLEWVNSKK